MDFLEKWLVRFVGGLRLNGTGYPNNLKGGDIILEARILAVADTVEAMTGRRPYRLTPGLAAGLKTIQTGSASLFDPEVVTACVKVFENGFTFNGIVGASAKSHETQHL
jgi:HD-GYP domain-containing protein (c-di-GMP phosphodiesterase class II)